MPTAFPAAAYRSPKRERKTDGLNYPGQSAASPSPSMVSISSLPEAKLLEGEDLGSHSPRTAVAGRLGELAIRGGQLSSCEGSSDSGVEESVAPSTPAEFWTESQHNFYSVPGTVPAAANDAGGNGPEFAAQSQHQCEDGAGIRPSLATIQKETSSPRKKRNLPAKTKARGQRGSPPLVSNAVEDPLTWHDSEITGHQQSDPNDDGYGINGIGFKPTAAMAWARSQKRQRQVADWKSRETREAREKRRERREHTELDKMRTVQQGAIQKKVKFDV